MEERERSSFARSRGTAEPGEGKKEEDIFAARNGSENVQDERKKKRASDPGVTKREKERTRGGGSNGTKERELRAILEETADALRREKEKGKKAFLNFAWGERGKRGERTGISGRKIGERKEECFDRLGSHRAPVSLGKGWPNPCARFPRSAGGEGSRIFAAAGGGKRGGEGRK